METPGKRKAGLERAHLCASELGKLPKGGARPSFDAPWTTVPLGAAPTLEGAGPAMSAGPDARSLDTSAFRIGGTYGSTRRGQAWISLPSSSALSAVTRTGSGSRMRGLPAETSQPWARLQTGAVPALLPWTQGRQSGPCSCNAPSTRMHHRRRCSYMRYHVHIARLPILLLWVRLHAGASRASGPCH